MNRIQIFSIQSGDGEHEAFVLSDMTKQKIEKEWHEYYWSPKYDNYRGFIKAMSKKGHIIELLDSKDEKIVVIDICPS